MLNRIKNKLNKSAIQQDLANAIFIKNQSQSLEKITGLIATKINLNETFWFKNPINQMGKSSTFLTLAIQAENAAVLELLLKSGVNPNTKPITSHCYPLSMAVQYGNMQIIELLVKHGANPDLVDAGEPAIKIAASKKNLEAVKFLAPLTNSKIKGIALSFFIGEHLSHRPLNDNAGHCIEIFNTLINNNADLNFETDDNFRTILEEFFSLREDNNNCFKKHKFTLIATLLSKGANTKSIQKLTSILETAINVNTQESLALVNPLLKAGANIDTLMHANLLETAISKGQVDVTAALLISNRNSKLVKSFKSKKADSTLTSFVAAEIKVKAYYEDIPKICFWIMEDIKKQGIFASLPIPILNEVFAYIIEPIKNLIDTFAADIKKPMSFATYHHNRLFAKIEVIREPKEQELLLPNTPRPITQ